YLARPEEMGDYIDAVVATCDHVAARRGSAKRLMLSFDEWNVWQRGPDRPKPEPWAFAPHLAEGAYTVEDALVVGGMLITLLNHCDRVRVACIAQVVNVLGPIMTAAGGPAWRNTIFFPFADASRLGRGLVLQPVTDVPTYDTADRPAVPYLAASYVLDPETGGLAVLAVNRHTDEPLELALELRAFDELKPGEWRVLRHDDVDACNTADSPDAVAPGTGGEIAVDGARLTAVLAPASWNAIRLLPA
ncbi:MAG: alpha-L-arabinofuranosidase C-terminal domain-containing protein, partial [Planctomycetota bacterium]